MADKLPETTTNSTTVIPEVKRTHPVKRFFRKLFLSLFFLLLLVATGTYFYFNYTYSDGNRAGNLVKFSKKGMVFKTYEGELNLGGINPMPGNTIANNVWSFSVKDEATAKQLMMLEGKTIRLHYKEKIKNLPWQGDTKYFVDHVELVK